MVEGPRPLAIAVSVAVVVVVSGILPIGAALSRPTGRDGTLSPSSLTVASPEPARSTPSLNGGISSPVGGPVAALAGSPAAPLSSGGEPSMGRVTDTTVLYNGTVIPGNYLPANGLSPAAVAYDPANGDLYVASQQSNNLTVVDAATNQTVGVIPLTPEGGVLPALPTAMALDGSNGKLFVADSNLNVLSVINTTTGSFIGVVPAGRDPTSLAYITGAGVLWVGSPDSQNSTLVNTTMDVEIGAAPYATVLSMAFDAANGCLYLGHANLVGPPSVDVVDVETGGTVAYVTVGSEPIAMAYDAADGDVYVLTQGSEPPFPGNVTVINGATNQIVARIPIGPLPDALAADPSNGYVYVASPGILGVSNVTVINGTTNRAVASIDVAPTPTAVAVDASDHDVYVANEEDGLSVIDWRSDTVVGSIAVGSQPDSVAYDPVNEQIYLGDFNNASVAVMNGTTDRIEGWIPAVSSAAVLTALAVDTADDYVYAAGYSMGILNAGFVAVINGKNDTLVGVLPLTDASPVALAYDAGNGYVYVANAAGKNVTVIDGGTATLVGTIPIGYASVALAYDAVNGDLYVCEPDGYVTVINATTDAVVTRVAVPVSPTAAAFDPENRNVYVASSAFPGGSGVTVIDGATNAVVSQVPLASNAAPIALAFDAANGYVYVSECPTCDPSHRGFGWAVHTLSNVTAINGSTDTVLGSLPVGESASALTYDGDSGDLYVTNAASGSVSVLDPSAAPWTESVTFRESGLPSGKPWRVELAGLWATIGANNSTFEVGVGWSPYLVVGPHGYQVASGEQAGTLVAIGVEIGLSLTVSLRFVRGPTPALSFAEKGLPHSLSWCADLDGWVACSAGGSLTFRNLTPANYSYSVSPTAGWNITARLGKTQIPVSGLLNVTRSETVSLKFAAPYSVTFQETGPPSGSTWSVRVVNGPGASAYAGTPLAFNLTNGTHPYYVGVRVNSTVENFSGKVVVRGTALTVKIALYPVTFKETGLPSLYQWCVQVGKSAGCSLGEWLPFYEPNGTYHYTDLTAAGFLGSATPAKIVVRGGGAVVSVTFQELFMLTFVESGLPSGTWWGVGVLRVGTTHGWLALSNSSLDTFSLTNGTYEFTVGNAQSGGTLYAPTPVTGTFVVNGAAVVEDVSFAS